MRYRNKKVYKRKGFGKGGATESAEEMGRMGGNSPGAGPDGNCICPKCGAKVKHQRGIPCFKVTCPKCGTEMQRTYSIRVS
jgi:hypothetical protein